jgi:hypothetical protein
MRLLFQKNESVNDYKNIDFSYNNILFNDIFDLIINISKNLIKIKNES